MMLFSQSINICGIYSSTNWLHRPDGPLFWQPLWSDVFLRNPGRCLSFFTVHFWRVSPIGNARLFLTILANEQLPQDFKYIYIIHIYKRNWNRQTSDNQHGSSLFLISGNILNRVLLNRLDNHLERGLFPQSQWGFRKERGTSDMVFAATHLQAMYQEQNTDLYWTHVDMTEEFDTVNRDCLWRIIAKYCCPKNYSNID